MEQQTHYLTDWPLFSTTVREQLHAQRRLFPKLAEVAHVSVRWVRSFSAGEYPGTRPDWVLALAQALGLQPQISITFPGKIALQEPMPSPRGGGKAKRARRARRAAPRKRSKAR